jgi:phosphohistidine phosphatase
MKLYLVRHGESIATGPDDEKSLSEKGIADIRRLAKFIASLKLQVSSIYHSPKLRTQQTAKILSSAMAVMPKIEMRIALEALAPIDDIYDEIAVLNEDIVMVGHMPFMGKLLSTLITGNENKDIVAFKTGCMVCLERIASTQWVICWTLNPELFI